MLNIDRAANRLQPMLVGQRAVLSILKLRITQSEGFCNLDARNELIIFNSKFGGAYV
jgi:hypothetical protein